MNTILSGKSHSIKWLNLKKKKQKKQWRHLMQVTSTEYMKALEQKEQITPKRSKHQ